MISGPKMISGPVSHVKSAPLKPRQGADSRTYEKSPPSMGATFGSYENPLPGEGLDEQKSPTSINFAPVVVKAAK